MRGNWNVTVFRARKTGEGEESVIPRNKTFYNILLKISITCSKKTLFNGNTNEQKLQLPWKHTLHHPSKYNYKPSITTGFDKP
jgi:hypothetical protein